MKNIITKNKNKRGPATYEAKGFRSGFVILFAVTLAALLLAIAIGVTNIAYREIVFGTNARDTNDAFFAADVGVEKALFDDKPPGIDCGPLPCSSSFTISGLGSFNQSCVNVVVEKTNALTTITSKGYNNASRGNDCDPNENSVERELRVTY